MRLRIEVGKDDFKYLNPKLNTFSLNSVYVRSKERLQTRDSEKPVSSIFSCEEQVKKEGRNSGKLILPPSADFSLVCVFDREDRGEVSSKHRTVTQL
jgi:hypothetical protein